MIHAKLFHLWVCCKLNHVYCDGPFYGPECHHNSYHHNEDYHPYSRTISKTKGDHHFYYTIPRTATVLDQTLNNYTGQPCMVNPNSAEAVVEIIDHKRPLTVRKSGKHWTVFHCDSTC